MINPMTPVVTVFQRVVYNPNNFENHEFALLTEKDTLWYLGNLGWTFAFGLGLLLLGFKMFDRLEANLGEEL